MKVKSNIIQKLRLLLIAALLACTCGLVHAQTRSITLNASNQPVAQVLKQIESQSGYTFFYKDTEIDVNRNVSVSAKDEDILSVLRKVFAGTAVEASIVGQKNISLTVKDAPVAQTPSQRSSKIKVQGTVMDSDGIPVVGATVMIEGTATGDMTDAEGKYTLAGVPSDGLLTFSCIGYQNQTKSVNGNATLNFIVYEDKETLEEAVTVAFGTQKKESVIGSITTVKPAELKVPSSNLTTALAGRVAGLISYQRSGEPGQDDATFFVRGVTSLTYANGPLILIDGVEMSSTDLARLQPDDIASFSIMKDATATALYGARGANGVILVNTKEGQEGKAKINIRYETSISQPTKELELADPVTYMELFNEAAITRDRTAGRPFTMMKIENTRLGTDPVMYPSVDWGDMLLKKSTVNQRVNANLSGGGKIARYYLAGTFNHDTGLLKVDHRNNFNSNIDLKKYVLRSNVNVNVTKTTEAIIRLHASFDDYVGPINGGSEVYSQIMNASPVLFLPYYEPDEKHKDTQHILFGNYDDGSYLNPYAKMVSGYKEYSKTTVLGQFELKQDLRFITEGLKARIMASTTRYSYFDVSRSYKPFYYVIAQYDSRSKEYMLDCLNKATGTEYLNYNPGSKSVTATDYFEAAINYDRDFGRHGISGLLVGTARNYRNGATSDLIQSLPQRNLGLSGRFTYNYDRRYFAEFNFGYNGSERFAANERFGFFPSAGVSWFISNEKFYKGGFKEVVDKLKLKATYGLVGNDAIGDTSQRFFYMSNVNMDNSSVVSTFGEEFTNRFNGVTISKYANDKVTWERSYKMNLGLEATLFKMMDLNVEYYTENRTGILLERAFIPSTMGLVATPSANVGEAMARGIDASLDINKSFSNGFWITGRFNFTYGKAWYTKYEDIDRTLTPWLSKVGQPVSQKWGYVAERLFVDEEEVKNSPVQFGEYLAGDIKYKDIDGDGRITTQDKVPIGYPQEPEIVYGFGFSTGFKGFDFSVFFQGLARESFWINVTNTSPFVTSNGSVRQLLKVYADDHWDESTRNIYALWPRLSTKVVENNAQASTWFMRDGSFMRLKSLECGYTIPRKLTDKVRMTNFRLYFSGTNLFCWSKFKLWDPEQAGNAFNYPTQRVLNFGAQVSF